MLVNQIVNDVDLLERTMKLAAFISSKSSVTVSRRKKTFYRQLDQPLKEAYKLCSEVMVNNMFENEAKEGIDAFINKRLPNWNIEDD